MNVKFERFFCFVFEPEYFVKHLEEMALKGWRLKSIGPGWILRYERIAPQRLYYAADVLGCRRKGSEKDRRKDLFTQFCWNNVCSNGMITVYVSEAGKTYDRELENPWSRAPHFLGVLYLLFLIYAGLAVWITRQNYIEITANLYFPLIPAAGAALLAKAVAGTVYYALWRRWKKKQLPVSTKPLYAKAKNFVSLIPHIIMLGALIFCVADARANADYIDLKFYSEFLLLGFLLICFAWLLVRSLLKRDFSFRALVLLVVAAVVFVYEVYTADYFVVKDEYSDYMIVKENYHYAKLYKDKLPLTMSDMGRTVGNYYGSTYIRHRNAFASYEEYEDYSVNHLSDLQIKRGRYEVFASKFDCLIDAYLRWELQADRDFVRTDNPAWGADAVYEEKEYPYRKAAVYDGKVVVFYYFEQLSDQAIDMIKEKLINNQAQPEG